MKALIFALAITFAAPAVRAVEVKEEINDSVANANWIQSYITLEAKPEIVAGPIEELDFHSPLALISECDADTFSTPMAVAPTGDGLLSSISGDLDLTGVILDQIINIGAKIWNIVLANAPVVTTNMPSAFALPAGTQCWIELENWETPKSQLFTVAYKNLLGMEVVNFSYRIIYTAGGSYNGAGQYLANVTVHPAKIDVAWGFTFNSEVSIGQIMNLGSRTNPEAGMEIAVKWQINTPFNHRQKTENYFIRGNGAISQL